jgi:hypothetical protein
MVDSGTITRSGTAGTVNPATGVPVTGAVVTVWSGPCLLAERRVQNPTATPIAGDFPFSEVATLKVPSSVPKILPMDVFTLDSAPDHPQDVGRRFRITSFDPSTQAKERRFQMSAIIG